jgi:hypothetical protein
MITYSDIKKALEHLKMPSKRYSKALHRQLAMSLEVYISRGEFSLDGNIYEAASCLELAGYEVKAS